MRPSLWLGLATLHHVGSGIATPTSRKIASMRLNAMWERDDDFDESDLSFIKKLAAIGDSYSAGIGAGDRLGTILNALDPHSDWACSRYDNAYPYLINEDGRLGDASTRKFQFESCSGAVTADVIDKQIPRIDSDQQVILLSAGGNDAELVTILNQCIFQWAVLDKTQVAIAKLSALDKNFAWARDYDWDSLGRGCEGQMDRSLTMINSGLFSARLDSLLNSAKKKLAPDGMIYYTGYAKFFAEDMSPACDKVTWTTWIYKAVNVFQKEQYLTTAHRKRMNALVDAMNAKLADAVKRAGPQVTFVNYDQYVGKWGGRYCEAGVNESTSESNTRTGLMLYELNSWDPLGSTPWKRSNDDPLNGTFNGEQEILAQITLLLDPHAEFTHTEANDGFKLAAQANRTRPIQAVELPDIQVPNLLPDGYGRVFHPQVLLHHVIANLVIYHMVERNELKHGDAEIPEMRTIDSCPVTLPGKGGGILHYKNTKPGVRVKRDTELRILPVGDSITVGFLSDRDGGDGNGYRLRLRDDLSKDEVVFAGTEASGGSMDDGYFAAWSGKTIDYIADHVGPSLKQRPNIILLHAGTNDMNPDSAISMQGNNPEEAADRLGSLIDQMIDKCPDAVILVAVIVNTCRAGQSGRTEQYQALIPDVVKRRRDRGHHVLAVDFTSFPTSLLRDCIHPSNEGYKKFGDYWYDFITQIPKDWIHQPKGDDPVRDDGASKNGGIDRKIPPPDWGTSPVQPTSPVNVEILFAQASKQNGSSCKAKPVFRAAGQISFGVGRTEDWKFHKDWRAAGKLADGFGLDPRYVRLHDMNGDGKADYVWLNPKTGEIRCWLNNLPEPWSPAGTNNSIIGAGAGPAATVYLADMNGDGRADYLVVNPDTGAVKIWWNHGPDADWSNGWKFVQGGQIASGVRHANLETLRFPDINGDGRADYVYIGAGGSLRHFMNTGTVGGQDVRFRDQGGIATGATSDISKLVFADMNGDGRDDYLIWDDDGGLSGFLNQRTRKEGVPLYIKQGAAKSIADGISKDPASIRLADMDGDGKDDYVHVDSNGGLRVWYNRGKGDTRMVIDNVHFARFFHDGPENLIYLDQDSGAPYVYNNSGPDDEAPFGFSWSVLNKGEPLASGAAPAANVHFGDIDGDGIDDYLVINPKTGKLIVYLNQGPSKANKYNWLFKPIGSLHEGLGPGANVRFADIDGDGRDDYIYLHPNGRTTIYRNTFTRDRPGPHFLPMPRADASGISQRPEEISFQDINHDGKADYVWTSAIDSSVHVWLNNYPNKPTWLPQGKIADGAGTSGANVKWGELTGSGYPDYVAFDPVVGAFAAWLNGCEDTEPLPGQGQHPPGSGCNKDEDCKWEIECPEGYQAGCTLSGIGANTCSCVAD
ncbi:SGNH hydrolase-type esterase domain-containing protein [Trichoderma novae-zelandiae]